MQTSFTSSVATPGTPQRLHIGATPALPTVSGVLSGTITPSGNQIVVTSDPANTAGKYLWIGGPAMSVSGNSGWSFKISPGGSAVISNVQFGTPNVADWFIDTDGTTAKYGVEVNG